jgi:hypothetical protein
MWVWRFAMYRRICIGHEMTWRRGRRRHGLGMNAAIAFRRTAPNTVVTVIIICTMDNVFPSSVILALRTLQVPLRLSAVALRTCYNMLSAYTLYVSCLDPTRWSVCWQLVVFRRNSYSRIGLCGCPQDLLADQGAIPEWGRGSRSRCPRSQSMCP